MNILEEREREEEKRIHKTERAEANVLSFKQLCAWLL